MVKRMQSGARKADKTVARKARAGRPAYAMKPRGRAENSRVADRRMRDLMP